MDLKEIILVAVIWFIIMKVYQFIKNKDRWKNKNPFK